jgi:hypothetical protein
MQDRSEGPVEYNPTDGELAAASHPQMSNICKLVGTEGYTAPLLEGYSLTVADILLLRRCCTTHLALVNLVKELDPIENDRTEEAVGKFLVAKLRSIDNVLMGRSIKKIKGGGAKGSAATKEAVTNMITLKLRQQLATHRTKRAQPKSKSALPPYWCTLCKCGSNKRKQWLFHAEGRRHLSNVKFAKQLWENFCAQSAGGQAIAGVDLKEEELASSFLMEELKQVMT